MRRTLIAALLLAAVTSLGWLASTSRGDRTEAAPPESVHERTIRYWTAERVAQARPREIVVRGPVGQTPAKGKPGGGGGGSGGTTCGSLTVTGATWTCDSDSPSATGDVAETTGKVLFTLDSGNYVCSGSLVTDGVGDRSLVLTAGHCVFDDAANKFARNWMFIPAYQDGGTFTTCSATAFGCWTAESLVTTTSFAGGSLNADYAFAVMLPGGKAAGELDAAVGSHAIAFDTAPSDQVFAFGYPAAQKYKGRALAYCAGLDFLDPYGSTDVGVGCDMTGGSSGGPWFKDFNTSTGVGTVTSLNSFHYFGINDVMFGPRFDGYTSSTFTAAKSATQCTLVPPTGAATVSACP